MSEARKRLEDARERWRHNTDAARVNVRLGDLRQLLAEGDRMREALERLRDCDWVITPLDRMDAVRDIARQALTGKDG